MLKDKQGNPYLRIADAKEDMTVWLDDSFTCRSPGPVVLKVTINSPEIFVEPSSSVLYFECDEGCHMIDGQCDDGIHCIGIYASKPIG